MKIVNCKNVNISTLSLGTVQLGMNYGINNAEGKPDASTANAILNCAMENGINVLDTAGAYGDSELIIGNWLKTISPDRCPFIVTKAAGLKHGSLRVVKEDLQSKVAASKRRLGVEQLDMLMIHNFDDYLCDKDNVRQAMEEIKAAGDIRFTGASAYSNHDYGDIAETGFDGTQIPVNLFDWKQIENGGLKKLEESGMMVFVRSVYLQGLIFKNPDQLEPKMEFARETLEKFRHLCTKFQLAPAALALSYAFSLPGVTSLVLGSEKVEQVQENIKLMNQIIQLNAEQLADIRDCFIDTPIRVLNPSLW